tara:strand:- start:2028 stop:2237 length:210 start_codon:yes stop_codon:yes gene_type:complete
MLDKDFSSDWYSAILGNLRDNDYLTQSDVDVLLKDSLEDHSIVLSNIDQEKAEIVRNALLENSKRSKFR